VQEAAEESKYPFALKGLLGRPRARNEGALFLAILEATV
jgi:hypothetical protein